MSNVRVRIKFQKIIGMYKREQQEITLINISKSIFKSLNSKE